MQRTLSAILVADMVGYSRLMEGDELGTLERHMLYQGDLINPVLARYQGRIVKTTGDGLLAEFPSVVGAVACAVEFQREMQTREADRSQDQRICYRVGINLGDVIHTDGDIHGDGVNIAARLEQLAEPGGICISGTAYDQLRSTVDAGYEDLGDVQVKNISRPIRAYRVLLDTAQVGVTIAAKPKLRQRSGMLVVGALVIALVAGLGGWWASRPDITPADPAKYAFELPDKPSIAVLAFDNLSGDAANDYIGDGLSENIIATLATLPKLFVIARNSSFTYKGKATQVQQIAEELGVRYVLEGSVQLTGPKMRVTAQLNDALDGRHVWAKTFDRELSVGDLFAIQDGITRDIALSLDAKLVSGNTRRSSYDDVGDLQSIILLSQASAEFQKFSPEGNQNSETLLLRVLKRNPDSTIVNLNLGWTTWYKVPLGQSKNPKATFAEARAYANKALETDPKNPRVYSLLGWLDMSVGDHESALKNAAISVELSPGGGGVASTNGWIYSSSGNPKRGAELLRFGMRTEPYYPDWVANSLASSLMMLSQYDEAKVLLENLTERASPTIKVWATNSLAIIAVWQGDIQTAKNLVAKNLETSPGYNIKLFRRYNYLNKNTAYVDRMADALIVAGLPENSTAAPGTAD
jgi:adenylate cyclase